MWPGAPRCCSLGHPPENWVDRLTVVTWKKVVPHGRPTHIRFKHEWLVVITKDVAEITRINGLISGELCPCRGCLVPKRPAPGQAERVEKAVKPLTTHAFLALFVTNPRKFEKQTPKIDLVALL